MNEGKLISFLIALSGIGAAIIFSYRGWPAVTYQENMLQAGTSVAGALFVIALFLERAMAVVNSILFGAETIRRRQDVRFAILANPVGVLTAEQNEALLDRSKKRVRLAGSFLIAILIAISGVSTLSGLIDADTLLRPDGTSPLNQSQLFRTLDILITAAVLAGGSSGIAEVVDLLKQRVDTEKAEQAAREKAASLGVDTNALSMSYRQAAMALGYPASTAMSPSFAFDGPSVSSTDRMVFADPVEPDDGAAYLEWLSGATGLTESAMMTPPSKNWRVAGSLEQLRGQLDEAFPTRNRASDGTIGDARHCGRSPNRSDHCPNIQDGDRWVVTAFDATHDPENACDMDRVTDAIIRSADARIKYIIWNRRICSSYPVGNTPAWTWRPYSGANPHEKHAHFSVRPEKTFYDDAGAWQIK